MTTQRHVLFEDDELEQKFNSLLQSIDDVNVDYQTFANKEKKNNTSPIIWKFVSILSVILFIILLLFYLKK